MQQDAVLEFLRGNNLKLYGDGLCDSSGYSAKYCTYGLSHCIYLRLKVNLVIIRDWQFCSNEKGGLRQSLNYLLKHRCLNQ